MMKARLSKATNYAIAVLSGPDSQFRIMLGNIPKRERVAVYELLTDEAESHFGAVVESGTNKGSVPGRHEAYVVVRSSGEKVLEFVKERLGGGGDQRRVN